jgi:hypothetical protein
MYDCICDFYQLDYRNIAQAKIFIETNVYDEDEAIEEDFAS